jgi:hypothetical protein
MSNSQQEQLFDEKSLRLMHYLKTGKLIEVSAVGAGLIAEVDAVKLETLRNFGRDLGIAFQVADDLLDQHQKHERHKSFVGLWGMPGAQEYMAKLNKELNQLADSISTHADILKKLILFNSRRQI